MKTIVILIAVCALLVMPSSAQSAPAPNSCSPAGIWYGGGDYKYVMTITPIAGQTFAIRGEGAFDNTALGYKGWTAFSGQLTKQHQGRYVAQEIAMFTTSSELPPPPNSLELDGVRGWMEFVDCDNVKFTYDFFGAYFDLNKIPFVDLPDISYLPPGGISETYHRMPTTCPACDIPAAPSTQLQRRR